MSSYFNKVLVANRGEVAARIVSAAWSLGIKPVVVYTSQDYGSPYLYQAYQALHLSDKDGLQPYMNSEELVSLAKQVGADAVHPGYGFLSEDAAFAQMVQDAGLCWVGPSPQLISLLGDKKSARALARKLSISVVPGFEVSLHESDEQIQRKAEKLVGYPLFIKDPLSGGGRGVKVVERADAFVDAVQYVKLFAQRVTGAQSLVIERYLSFVRHVEVQIAGDGHNVVHLYERDCSVQRRYQKIIEESPCSFAPSCVLDNMYSDALCIARYLKYDNLGTVEFLLDEKHRYYFLEMNTRLQVEHGVTELLTGIDLVALQFKLAAGKMLDFQQDAIKKRGHVLECRLYAEDPSNNFLPSTGKLSYFYCPSGPFIRHDHDLYSSKEISHQYDPMLSKIITFGDTREKAVQEMLTTLRQLCVGGITTNILFLIGIVSSDLFKNGNFDTRTFSNKEVIDSLIDDALQNKKVDDVVAIAAAAFVKFMQSARINDTSESQNCDIVGWKKALWKQKNFI